MRIGWDEDHIFAVKNAQAVERAGGAAVAVHGRTRVQMYEGTADWDIIGEVKKNVSIPVIGNGDISTPQEAKERLEKYGVDGVMIGRAALGNPWMLYRTVQYLQNGEIVPDPDAREKMNICMLHLDRLIDLKGENVAVREMRKHAAWYLKGLPKTGSVRNEVNQMTTRDDMSKLLFDYVDQVEEIQQKIIS